MTRAPLLAFETVQVAFPRGGGRTRAVRDVSFDVAAGEIFALVGESGSGKTSLARSVLGLAPLVGGCIRWRGESIHRRDGSVSRELRRRVQYVFQDPAASLSPRRTVRQSLLEPLELYAPHPRPEWPERIAAALAAVDLDDSLLGRRPHELSGGQAQRVAIARALLADPELLIADEPTSALDVTVQARLIRLLLRLRESRQISLLLISHDLAVVRQIADRVGVMYSGELLELADADELFSRPAHPYTRMLLAAVPSPDPRKRATLAPPSRAAAALTPHHGCVFHSRCPQAVDICGTVRPEDYAVGEPQRSRIHIARCHLCAT